MEFTEIDILFGSAVTILSALSFVGIIYIMIADTGKHRSQMKQDEDKKKLLRK